jgi:uncharacterized protein
MQQKTKNCINPIDIVKLTRLQKMLIALQKVIILFSGGVDSSLLLKVAADTLGEGVTALTFWGPHCPAGELAEARELAQTLGLRHLEQEFDPLQLPDFRHNTLERCYACKKEIFTRGNKILAAWGGKALLDGANWDDLQDFRPGQRAARELGIRSPLQEIGLTKEEIRTLSQSMGLPQWNKPSQSCLATRFPTNTLITRELLGKVATAEEFLQQHGFAPVRLRVHDLLVRLELPPEQWPRLMEEGVRLALADHIQQLGWRYLTLDLKGYQTGSMN